MSESPGACFHKCGLCGTGYCGPTLASEVCYDIATLKWSPSTGRAYREGVLEKAYTCQRNFCGNGRAVLKERFRLILQTLDQEEKELDDVFLR